MPLKLYRRPGSHVWYIRGSVRGIRVYESTKTDKRSQAEAIKAKRESELFDQAVFGARAMISFVVAAQSYLEFEERSASTALHIERLIEHFGSTPVAKIDQDAADKAVAAILKKNAAPATKARGVYTPLTSVLNHAHRRGWCDRPSFEKPSVPRGKTRWLTPEEALRLVAAAAPHLQSLMIFILCTGARMAEALDLQWADVDLPAAKVVLRDTKNGRDRPAVLPPAAVAMLANLPHRLGPVFLRPGRVVMKDDRKERLMEPYADKERQAGGQTKTGWRAALRRAGITEPTTPHDLRHSWATYFYAITKDLLLLKAEGGWESASMCERYAHLMPSELVGEICKLWGATHPRIGNLPVAKTAKADEKRA